MSGKIVKKKITFKYYAPEAEAVAVVGTFNGWNSEANPLKKDKEGNWSTVASLYPGNYEYRYIVDGGWRDDPTCEIRHLNLYGGYNCVLYLF
ncbi:MAG TPA: isoamylase early set domain-containing protein [Syntrophales bacterium]|nr:isoamylase early set domain-containing protein [Syntrophales bacterium]